MDGYGIIIFVIGILGYAILNHYKRIGWASLFAWISGIGAGIFIGAIWAIQIINSVLGG